MKLAILMSMSPLKHTPAWAMLMVVGAITFTTTATWANGSKFPYEASIFTDNVEIHSGPSSRFYVTGSLKKETRVQVHRHDPGGWYMIAPPAGSFSLVRAEYVKKESPRNGVVTENNVVVRVGSQVNEHHEVEQRRLMKGDRVNILGEQKITDHGREVLMLKIEPPKGEFRWVKGDFIVPLDPAQRKVHDTNPYAFPANSVEVTPEGTKPVKRPDAALPVAAEEDQPRRPRPGFDSWDNNTAVVSSGFDPEKVEKDRQVLDALDRNFRDMIQQDISTWNLRDLSHDYKKLQSNTKIQPIASQIDLRLQAMERYRKIKAEYDDLTRLTSGTDRRDAQLLSLQQSHETAVMQATDDQRLALGNETGELEFLPNLGPNPAGPTPAPTPVPGHSPPAGPGRPQTAWGPSTHPHPSMMATRLAGAGIVKKVGGWDRRTPAYVLVSPTDALLAYLEPAPGVNLEAVLGQSMGIIGSRRHVPELQADLIQVTGLSPVRLQQ